MLGLVLAAPITSAAVHITRDLGAARVRAKLEAEKLPTEELPSVPAPTATSG
jgi:hypothetical protein